MQLHVFSDQQSLAHAAAQRAAECIRRAIAASGDTRIVAATGVSQVAFLQSLTSEPDIDWSKVEMFHLDEYVGISASHPASFRRYLRRHLIEPTGLTRFHLLDGDHDPAAVCRTVGRELAARPVDVAFVGIGENGHLAFNDPPADFATEEPYLIVSLDDACRRQQVGEGWFETVDDVPRQAITMSIRQILKSRTIIAVVPEARKAVAVRRCFEGEISPDAPASILRTHADTSVFLDTESAALLGGTKDTKDTKDTKENR